MNRKLVAEFVGTFVLSLMVSLSVAGNFVIPTPVLAAAVLFIFVYTIGGVSGCHINPAVTLGLFSIGKINRDEAMRYLGAQLLAGVATIALVNSWGIELGEVTPGAWVAELLGMIVFTFGIGAVVMGQVKSALSGVVVGGSLLLGISLSVLGGGPGILNPAVAVGLRVFEVIFWFAEIGGAVLGFGLAKYLFKE